MAGMYDGVSASGMIDTISGNYNPQTSNSKSTLNSLIDAGKAVLNVPKDAYLYANDLTNRYVAQPLSDYVVGPTANYVSDSMAERDYAAEHGGQYPASPEELAAYKSYKAKDMQGALSTPATQAQDKQNEIQAGIQESQQKQADLQAQGYKQVPDAGQDPVGHISALNENKSKGVGGFSGNVNTPLPTPPTQTQVQDMNLNAQGKQAAFDQNKIPAWYKSNSFNMGLISFGLNLLSGNDLATSFGAAGEAFNQMYGEERRSYWAEDLAKQGYDPVEIEEWKRTGDSKVLTSPQEKQMKMIQQRLQMQQLDNALYEGSPEMRQYQLGREQRKDALTEAQIRNSIANSNAQLGLSRERLNFEKSKYAAKQAAAGEDPEWGITNPEARMVLQQGKKFTDDSNLKRSRMAVAQEAAQKAKQLLEAGDTAGAAAAYDQYEESYGKAMQGGLGKIDRHDASDIAGPRTWWGQASNAVVRGVRGAPTSGEIERAIASSNRGINTEHQVVVDNLQSMYENLIPKIGADRARAAVKFQANGSGIGNWEPKASRNNVTFH
ncbi:hypothetical protein ECO319P1_00087 [Escherichia phage ECO319P1]|nr:hypothetical protein ECO319P1_00087 [Escherichia phage ECO319P1]